MNADRKRDIEAVAAYRQETVPDHIRNWLRNMRSLCPGKQPEEWHYIDWLLEEVERLKAETEKV